MGPEAHAPGNYPGINGINRNYPHQEESAQDPPETFVSNLASEYRNGIVSPEVTHAWWSATWNKWGSRIGWIPTVAPVVYPDPVTQQLLEGRMRHLYRMIYIPEDLDHEKLQDIFGYIKRQPFFRAQDPPDMESGWYLTQASVSTPYLDVSEPQITSRLQRSPRQIMGFGHYIVAAEALCDLTGRYPDMVKGEGTGGGCRIHIRREQQPAYDVGAIVSYDINGKFSMKFGLPPQKKSPIVGTRTTIHLKAPRGSSV